MGVQEKAETDVSEVQVVRPSRNQEVANNVTTEISVPGLDNTDDITLQDTTDPEEKLRTEADEKGSGHIYASQD